MIDLSKMNDSKYVLEIINENKDSKRKLKFIFDNLGYSLINNVEFFKKIMKMNVCIYDIPGNVIYNANLELAKELLKHYYQFKYTGYILGYLNGDLRYNEEIILLAIKGKDNTLNRLNFVPYQYTFSKEFIYKAREYNKDILSIASEDIKDDFNFIKKDLDKFYKYASDRLKKDKVLAQLAIINNKETFLFLNRKMKWNNKIIRLYKDKKIIFNNLKTYERVINKKDKYLDSLSNEELKKLYKLYDERVTYLLDRCDCNIDLLSKKEIKIIAYKVVIYNKIKNKECFINR